MKSSLSLNRETFFCDFGLNYKTIYWRERLLGQRNKFIEMKSLNLLLLANRFTLKLFSWNSESFSLYACSAEDNLL